MGELVAKKTILVPVKWKVTNTALHVFAELNCDCESNWVVESTDVPSFDFFVTRG